METIGSRIKFLRKSEGLKQVDFANRVLVSASYISKVESGREIPSEIFTKLVSLEFGVSYLWLKDGIGNMQVNSKEYDYFERNNTNTSNLSKEITALNAQILLAANNSFRELNISAICHDLTSLLKTDLTDNQKDLLIEILSCYIGTMEEFTQRLYSIKNSDNYLEESAHQISSYLEDIKKCLYDFSGLLT